MFNIEPKGEYIDVMELCLYNGIISGMSVDGKSFFYVNPLEVYPEATRKDQLKAHVKTVRQKWFGCSCCPPNLARLLASYGAYAYSKNKNTFYLNLFGEGTAATDLDCGKFGIEITTNYPWDEKVLVKITDAANDAVFAIRIPGWCENHTVKLNGADASFDIKDGYAFFNGLKAGDALEFIFKMPVVVLDSNPRIRENIGKAAVKRGPVVYCIEEADNGNDLHLVYLSGCAEFETVFDANFFGGAVTLKSSGKKLNQADWCPDNLYRTAAPQKFVDISLKWIPYYLWANRGEGEMTVWVNKE